MPAPAPPLQVETEQLPGSQIGLTIEVPQETVDATYERVLNRLAQRARIEGFRPGKAPRPLVEARLGAAAIRDEVIEALVPAVVGQAMAERSIDAIDRPRVEVVEFDRGRPARLTAKVSVMPTVTLPDLTGLSVERRHTEVTDEMAEQRLKGMLESQAELEPVDREVRLGDVVVADLEVEVDGSRVESERRNAAEFTVAEGRLRPELLAVVPGAAIGQEVSADTVLPEDHSIAELRDKPARLHVTIRGVKERRLPELTDELAAELSGGRQTTAEGFRQAIRTDLVESSEQLDRMAHEQGVLRSVVEGSKLEVPESMVEREVDREMETMERSLQRQGLRVERYLEYLQQTEDQWRVAARNDAEARVRTELVLDELARTMAVEPTEAEIEASLREEADRDAEIAERLSDLLASSAARDYFRHRLQRAQVLQQLMRTVGGIGTELPEAPDSRPEEEKTDEPSSPEP